MADDQKILPPDLDRIDSQVRVIEQAYRDRFDQDLPKGIDRLAGLQRMLDAKIFRAEETYKLQSMGIVLGQVLAAAGDLKWVTVSDQYGEDPALQFKQTSILLFPMTMISKRIEKGESVDVDSLYEWSLAKTRELELKDY